MRIVIYLLSISGLISGQELLANTRCNHPVDRGECQNFAVQWHYDRYAHRCREFYYGGCGGNENRFETKEACESSCTFIDDSARARCSQPYDAGNCHSDISRHYFDMQKGACICANYTGCGGNNNMFYSYDQCMSVCGQFAKPNHIEVHDDTAEYTHTGDPANLTPLQLQQRMLQMMSEFEQQHGGHQGVQHVQHHVTYTQRSQQPYDPNLQQLQQHGQSLQSHNSQHVVRQPYHPILQQHVQQTYQPVVQHAQLQHSQNQQQSAVQQHHTYSQHVQHHSQQQPVVRVQHTYTSYSQPEIVQYPHQSHHSQQQPEHHLQQAQHHQTTHHYQSAADPYQQRYQQHQKRTHQPILTRQHRTEPNEEIGMMKQKKNEEKETTSEFSIGTTHIIRHGPDGSKFVTKLNGHPMVITEKIMEMVRAGQAESIDDAINKLSATNENLHLKANSTKDVPNYVYMNEKQPLNPVYKSVPQMTTNTVTSTSTFQNLPREAFIRPVDPEERRRWKEKMSRKAQKWQPVRRIEPSASTYYEVYTTPEPVPDTTTRRPEPAIPQTTPVPVPETRRPDPTTPQTTPAPVPETTTATRAAPTLPTPKTTPSPFYQESFDLEKIRKHKERVRNGKTPPQRPLDDYEDDRVPYETELEGEEEEEPEPEPAPTRATVHLPVAREELVPAPLTLKVKPSAPVRPTVVSHFDLEDGKEGEEEEEYEYEDDEELTITQRFEKPTVPHPTVIPVTVAPPMVTVSPTFESRSAQAMERPLRLQPPVPMVLDQTTTSTTTLRPRSEAPPVHTTRKSLFGSYESEEFDIRPAKRGSF